MTLKQIDHFLTLVNLGHVTHSAQALGISQSALSLSLKELERDLGGALFERQGKQLFLNDRGRLFHAQATPLHAQLSTLATTLRQGDFFHLRLAVSQSIGTYLLPSMVLDFSQNHPNARFDLRIENSETIVAKLLAHESDAGFVEGSTPQGDFDTTPLATDELIVVTGDKSLAKTPVFIDTLASLPWILREKGSGTKEVFENALPQGVRPKVALEINSNEAIKEALKGRKALSCLSRFVVQNELNQGTLFHVPLINLTFSRTLSLLSHPTQNPHFLAWKEAMETAFKNKFQPR
ncbi:MAG: LysR family transcriptional regulator [Campylobacterales bacterium]|nr:LysR family transcriptional regulator [Campylobacterales bacterium]